MRGKGRPTDYREEFVDKVYEYLEEIETYKNKLPTIQGFALFIGTSVDSIERWKDLYSDFCGALDELKNKQAQQLINDGIYNREANSTIIKLLLQNNHGMKERTDNTSNDETIVIPTIQYLIPKNANDNTED